jgi:hypothetical protein
VSGCRHVALFVFREDATESQITAVADGLAALPAQIPEIAAYRVGPDLGVNDGNHDYAVVADFASVEDYYAYRDHPVHQALLADTIRPILASRAAVQYDI